MLPLCGGGHDQNTKPPKPPRQGGCGAADQCDTRAARPKTTPSTVGGGQKAANVRPGPGPRAARCTLVCAECVNVRIVRLACAMHIRPRDRTYHSGTRRGPGKPVATRGSAPAPKNCQQRGGHARWRRFRRHAQRKGARRGVSAVRPGRGGDGRVSGWHAVSHPEAAGVSAGGMLQREPPAAPPEAGS